MTDLSASDLLRYLSRFHHYTELSKADYYHLGRPQPFDALVSRLYFYCECFLDPRAPSTSVRGRVQMFHPLPENGRLLVFSSAALPGFHLSIIVYPHERVRGKRVQLTNAAKVGGSILRHGRRQLFAYIDDADLLVLGDVDPEGRLYTVEFMLPLHTL